MKAYIVEIFSSFQGEGLWIGRRQIFVRFAGCNLDCNYCDTSATKSKDSGILMSVDEVFEKIEELETSDLHSISFTGGEPLLYADFINELSNKLSNRSHNKLPNKYHNDSHKSLDFNIFNNSSNKMAKINNENDIKIMIETNGTLPDSLSKIEKIDCVSLDIKLKEQLGQKWEDSIFENELATLKLMLECEKYIYCKLIISPSTTLNTIKNVGSELANILNNFDEYELCNEDNVFTVYNESNEPNVSAKFDGKNSLKIPIILQPASPVEQWKNQTDLLFKFSETMGKYMNVLVVPQTHEFLNIK